MKINHGRSSEQYVRVLKIDSLNTLSGTNLCTSDAKGRALLISLVPDGQLREKHTHIVSCPPCESTDQHIRAFLRLTKTKTASPAEEKRARVKAPVIFHITAPNVWRSKSVKCRKMGSNLKLFSAQERPARAPLTPRPTLLSLNKTNGPERMTESLVHKSPCAGPSSVPPPAGPLHYSSACGADPLP